MLEDSIKYSLKMIDNLLELYGKETIQLIHLYYIERHRIQQRESDCVIDKLKCQMILSENELRIEKLKIEFKDRKRNLLKYKSYVKVQLSPEDEFPKYQKLRTKLARGQQILKFKDDDDFKM